MDQLIWDELLPALRIVGLLSDSRIDQTRIIPVPLGHRVPPPGEISRRC